MKIEDQVNKNPLASENKVFPSFLKRSLVAALPVGFSAFFVANLFYINHPERPSQYIWCSLYFIVLLVALPTVLFGKKLEEKILADKYSGGNAVLEMAVLYCLLMALLVSLGWLIASSLVRIFSLIGS